jgi:hypothetical protein
MSATLDAPGARTHAPSPGPQVLGEPHLFAGERALMDRVFAEGCAHYLEFGLGGSTLLAAQAGARAIVAVDSDAAWVDAAARHPAVAPGVASGAVTLIHADIGPVGPWGMPRGSHAAALWPRYVGAAWRAWAARGAWPDLVYVDGRFRVACCLSAVLATPASAPPRILLHDMGPARPGYARVLAHLEITAAAGSLALLRPRADATRAAMLADLLEAQFDPG